MLSAVQPRRLPLPIFNIIDGAAAVGSGIGGSEFLLIPQPDMGILQAIDMGVRVRNGVRDLLGRQGVAAGDSPQGALLLAAQDCEYPLAVITEAALAAGYGAGSVFTLGLDLAATDYYDESGKYNYPWPALNVPLDATVQQSPEENLVALCAEYERLISAYQLSFIEDGFAEVDKLGWQSFSRRKLPVRLIGDDLCASNPNRIRDAYQGELIHGVLVKPNQIGTLTGAMEALDVARQLDLLSVVSQRSGENDDDSITHLAIAGEAKYLKFGGPSRMDRIMKLNSLLRIARELHGLEK